MSASLFLLIVTGFSVIVIIVICVNQIRIRRQALCRYLDRQYETVDEPIYEVVSNVMPNNEVWLDCSTQYNEAYQKTGSPLHLYSELNA